MPVGRRPFLHHAHMQCLAANRAASSLHHCTNHPPNLHRSPQDACCNECKNTPECINCVFSVSAYHQGRCWFKGKCDSRTAHTGLVIGTPRTGPAPPPPPPGPAPPSPPTSPGAAHHVVSNNVGTGGLVLIGTAVVGVVYVAVGVVVNKVKFGRQGLDVRRDPPSLPSPCRLSIIHPAHPPCSNVRYSYMLV